MNFGDEDELDFEEDLPENESKKSDAPENAEKKSEDSDINGCDQYLQIDCLDDEEDLLSKVTVDSEKPESTVQDKKPNTNELVDEENKKSPKKKECVENKRGENPLKSNFKSKKGKKRKERSFGVPLYRTPNTVCSNKWRSGINFMRLRGPNIGQGLTGLPLQYPKLHHFSQNYFQNQSDFVSLLGVSAAKNQTAENLQQINSLLAHCPNPMLEVRKNLITRNGFMGQCSNTVLNQFQCNDFSWFKGALQQKLAADANNKNFPVRSMNGLKTNCNRESFNEGHSDRNLPQGEKELKSKKEARLLRFMNYDTNRKEIKLTGNISEKPIVESLNLEEEYFRKMEEQKRKRQEIFSLKEKQNLCNDKSVTDALAINKELLLKKENPFENGCKMLGNSSVKFEIKQEKEEKKEEEVVNQKWNSPLKEMSCVKKEAKSPVKFVRTVSKSFEELGLSKTKNGLFSRIDDRNKSYIAVDSNLLFDNVPKAELVDTASQTQTEPHLTGCIVKVLNVPPATTANDILALFSPFGIVRELKLNFPKENSVAIRFAEPKSAENFFKLYNGRVFDSHILNVIIV